jgi:RHS repeat-associated protein
VRQLVDASGNVAAQYDYDPYGNSTTISGSVSSDIGYAGYFHHAASGLDFALFRAYDPQHGRWLNRDPIGQSGGTNIYAYVGENPLNFIDPFGWAGIWIEGSSPGEPGPHQSIGVGDPNGVNQTYSFGVNPGQSIFGGQGSVYLDTNKGGQIYNYYDVPDAILPQIQGNLAGQIGQSGTYNLLTNNCRNYSNSQLQQFVNQYNLTPATAPARTPTPSGSYPGGSSGAPTTNTGVFTSSPGPTL